VEAVADVADQNTVILDGLVETGGPVPVQPGVDGRRDYSVPQGRLLGKWLAEEAAEPPFIDGHDQPDYCPGRDEMPTDPVTEILFGHLGRILDDGPLVDRGHGIQGGRAAKCRRQPSTERRLAVPGITSEEHDSSRHVPLPESVKRVVQPTAYVQGIGAREPVPASTKRVVENLARFMDVARIALGLLGA
jgi:hypothetical protein